MYHKPQSYTVWFLRYREKSIWRCHHFKHVNQKSQSWYMLPEIWSVKDIIFSHFQPLFALLPPPPPPLSPPNNPENYNFEKMKRTAGYIIILQKRTINSNDSWDWFLTMIQPYVWFLRYEKQQTEFFVILGYFFALLPH